MAGVGWRASVRLEVWGALSIVFGLVKKGTAVCSCCAVLRETLLSERASEAEGAGLAGEARRRSKVTSLAGAQLREHAMRFTTIQKAARPVLNSHAPRRKLSQPRLLIYGFVDLSSADHIAAANTHHPPSPRLCASSTLLLIGSMRRPEVAVDIGDTLGRWHSLPGDVTKGGDLRLGAAGSMQLVCVGPGAVHASAIASALAIHNTNRTRHKARGHKEVRRDTGGCQRRRRIPSRCAVANQGHQAGAWCAATLLTGGVEHSGHSLRRLDARVIFAANHNRWGRWGPKPHGGPGGGVGALVRRHRPWRLVRATCERYGERVLAAVGVGVCHVDTVGCLLPRHAALALGARPNRANLHTCDRHTSPDLQRGAAGVCRPAGGG
jgi:hypothetical protein